MLEVIPVLQVHELLDRIFNWTLAQVEQQPSSGLLQFSASWAVAKPHYEAKFESCQGGRKSPGCTFRCYTDFKKKGAVGEQHS